MDAAARSRLAQLQAEHQDLLGQLGSPEVATDHERYAKLAKRVAELEEIVGAWNEYQSLVSEAGEAHELVREATDPEETEFYRTTAEEAEARAEELAERLNELLTPRDARDERDVIVEIRAGAGGDEAALFAGDLLRMYQRYADRKGWSVEVLDVSAAPSGGVKEVVFEVRGRGAFSKLKFESGVHRVQRVPATESSGRIHTSTVTVAVLAEADEVDVEIDPEDLRIDYFRSSGPGGQHVNTTDSAVRITHRPTGIVVACQSERSQRQNKDRGMRVLLAKLQELAEEEARAEVAAERRSQVGTGERAEKIRTYNFQQDRITDHRIQVTLHGIDRFLAGEIDELVDALGRERDAAAREAVTH